MKKNIVLAADQRYTEQIMTVIKSVCLHNKNIQFYLLHRDFCSEWFTGLNHKLHQINCNINGIQIENNEINTFKTLAHIQSDAAYFRYFIPQLLNEDKLLYLDCDLVVNGNLDALFDIELDHFFVAAAKDNGMEKFYAVKEFNSGVMLINNQLWREKQVTEKALSLSRSQHLSLVNGDQSVLNILFSGNWLKLDKVFNYQLGTDFCAHLFNRLDLIESLKPEYPPLIIHFNSPAKPWLNQYSMRFKHYYWFYYHLDWSDIIKRHHLL